MEDLVRRAASGDMAAFEQLVRDTTPKVRAVVVAHMSRGPEIDDLVQEVYLRALVGLPKLDDPERFLSWLYAIARNAARDHHRRNKRRPTDVVADIEEVAGEDRFTTEDLVELRDLASSVRIGVGRLSPLDATLLAMVAVLGFTPTDIAAALGMGHSAAKVALHRARNRLRAAMALQDSVAPTEPQMLCLEFRELAESMELVAAAVHARGCRVCSPGGRAQSPGPASPTSIL